MVYKCSICGYVYDEEKEGKPFSELTECPVCKQPPGKFNAVENQKPAATQLQVYERNPRNGCYREISNRGNGNTDENAKLG